MTELDDADYYAQRAKVERERADQSSDNLVAGIHRDMARRYAEKSGKSADVPLMTQS